MLVQQMLKVVKVDQLISLLFLRLAQKMFVVIV